MEESVKKLLDAVQHGLEDEEDFSTFVPGPKVVNGEISVDATATVSSVQTKSEIKL